MDDLIILNRSQVKDAATVIASAFHNDPPLVYSIPDAYSVGTVVFVDDGTIKLRG